MTAKIAYVTDIHLDETYPIEQGADSRKNWKIILQDISAKGINEIIFGGDIGEKASNRWFFESLINFKLSVILGNHDYFNEVTKFYTDSVVKNRTELYYKQLKGNYKFIFLDSSSGYISQEQFEWFQKELITTSKIIIFVHHPILGINAEVDKRFALKERNKIKEALLSIDNDVTIFCGHYHFDDEKSVENIQQYITPASSYQIDKIPNEIRVNTAVFGYRIIEIDDTSINTSLVMFS